MTQAEDELKDVAPGPMAWMARNPVVANLLMVCLLAGGYLSGLGIKQTVFPDFELDYLLITVPYPGASPEETEQAICLRLEEAVRDVDGIKKINCAAGESAASSYLELLPSAPKDRVLSDVKSAVDRISSFPANVERPIINLLVARNQAISLVLWGDASEKSLREQAEAIRDELTSLSDVTNVKIQGVRPLQTTVEIRRETLREHKLTLPMVAQALRRASLDAPGGSIKTRGGDILIRTKDQRFTRTEFAEITLLSGLDGSRLRLGDIAEIREEFKEVDSYSTYNGKTAVILNIERVGTQTPRSVAGAVKDYRAGLVESLPPGMHLDILRDWSKMLDERMNLLMRNAWMGLVLVLVVLGLFLEVRLAFWVTLGIPISFLGSLLLLPSAGGTINMISLFAFILVLGLVVDDAIVVGENIYELRQQGYPPLKAAVVGARQVGHPVTFSILTTMAAFAPLLFMGGMMGRFMNVIPIVVIAVLAMSLVEALFILPAHLSHDFPERRWLAPFQWIQGKVDGALQSFLSRFLQPLIGWCTRQRYVTMTIAMSTIVLTVAAVSGGHIKSKFFSDIEADRIDANIEMIEGVSPGQTEAVLNHVIAQARTIAMELQETDPRWKDLPECEGRACPPTSPLIGVYARMGSSLRERPGVDISSSAAHLASARIQFVPAKARNFSMKDFESRWRDRIGEPAGLNVISFRSNIGPQFGAPISVEFAHTDRAELERASDLLASQLKDLAGVVDIEDGRDVGKPELNLSLKPEARALGITEQDLAMQVRGAFFGMEAQRQQVGRDEVRVMVMLPREQRSHLADLEALIVRTPQGGEMRLGDAATITMAGSARAVRRVDGKRTLTVQAKVDEALTNTQTVNNALKNDLLPPILAEVPGLAYRFGGERQERDESMASLFRGLAFALLCIYVLVAIPFRSYFQPFAVMSAIPFGFVGAVWGHALLGMPLTVLSLMGLLAVTGVVVNDSLVLVAFINDYRKEGHSLGYAATVGAVRRFRPILLTSLTTFFGLAPMLMETSLQARFLVPMAVSLAFGVAFATIFILTIVPCCYLIIEDLKGLLGQSSEVEQSPQNSVLEPVKA